MTTRLQGMWDHEMVTGGTGIGDYSSLDETMSRLKVTSSWSRSEFDV